MISNLKTQEESDNLANNKCCPCFGFFSFWLQDRSIEKVAIAKGKKPWIFIFRTSLATGFLPCDVLLAFFSCSCAFRQHLIPVYLVAGGFEDRLTVSGCVEELYHDNGEGSGHNSLLKRSFYKIKILRLFYVTELASFNTGVLGNISLLLKASGFVVEMWHESWDVDTHIQLKRPEFKAQNLISKKTYFLPLLEYHHLNLFLKLY